MKKLYFLLVTILVTSLSFGQDLIITGAFDGPLSGGTPKGVELYVVSDIPNLSIYGIGSANNGQGTDGEEFTFPADAVTAGSFIYIATEAVNFNSFFGFDPDYTDGSMAINGDDAVELFMNGSVIDVFGTIDCDPNASMSPCPEWEHTDGWAYRVDGTGPEGTTFTSSNWTYSGIDAFDGETTNSSAANPFPIGTYSPTTNTNPTIAITSPNNGQDFNSGTTQVDVEFTVANAPGATVNISVIINNGAPSNTSGVSSPFTISGLMDGDDVNVTVDLVDSGILDSDSVDFTVEFPCDLQIGTIVETCDNVTPATTDTYNVTLDFTGGGTTTYTIDTGGVGTVSGDDPTSMAMGTITISNITEGTDFTITFTGNPMNSSCNFTRNINSPDCDPELTLPLYEGFDYAVSSNLIDSPNWDNISSSTDEILIGGPGGLTYPNLASSSQTGNHATFDGGGSDSAIEFTAVTTGTVYASFLINVTDISSVTTPGYFALLGDFDARLWIVPGMNAGEFQIGISNVNTVPTAGALDTTVLTTASTILVVMSYDTVSGVMNAWINPSDTTFGGSAPVAGATETDASPQTNMNQFALRQDSTSETPFILFDELRIGTSWAEVTPVTLSNNDFNLDQVSIYPNPTNTGRVTITSSNSDAMNVQVFDILGKQVKNEILTSNTLNVSNLNTGVYILKITQNNATTTKKLVIK